MTSLDSRFTINNSRRLILSEGAENKANQSPFKMSYHKSVTSLMPRSRREGPGTVCPDHVILNYWWRLLAPTNSNKTSYHKSGIYKILFHGRGRWVSST